ISRLEEMFYQCGKYINEVYENTNKRLTVAYSSTIKDTYYQTIFDIHKSIGVGVSFSYIDNDMIKDILAFPWSGRSYSQNLWINRSKLKNAMVQELTQMIIQGKGVKETSRSLSKRLDSDYKNCLRLIHTEHSYFMETSSQKAYVECDIDKYEILATLDKRTSKICQDLDGEVFNVKDAVIGINMPPFH
ncbi:MAG: minor capsid protein, partial [Peptostreptococcaceae bacterium]|nr:minor capsid protein [Peptostreptococcaceae bacterium]